MESVEKDIIMSRKLPDGSTEVTYPATRAGNILGLEEVIESGSADKAPILHSSEDTRFGLGSETKYGHVKLAENWDTTESGIAVPPGLVKKEIDKINDSIKGIEETVGDGMSEHVDALVKDENGAHGFRVQNDFEVYDKDTESWSDLKVLANIKTLQSNYSSVSSNYSSLASRVSALEKKTVSLYSNVSYNAPVFSSSSAGSYQTIANITGSGAILSLMFRFGKSGSGAMSIQSTIRLVIDDTTTYQYDARGTTSAYSSWKYNGSGWTSGGYSTIDEQYEIALMFTKGFKIEGYSYDTGTSGGSLQAFITYLAG